MDKKKERIEVQLNSVFDVIQNIEKEKDVELRPIKLRLGRLGHILNEDVFSAGSNPKVNTSEDELRLNDILDVITKRVKEKEKHVKSLEFSANPNDWKKAYGEKLVIMGLIEAKQLLQQKIKGK